MIYEKTCPICESKFRTNIANKVYCSHSCSNKGRAMNKAERGNYDESLEWFRRDGRWECPYEGCASCEVRYCDRCGWNPVVAKARLEEYKRKYREAQNDCS